MFSFFRRWKSAPRGAIDPQEWLRLQNRYADPAIEHAKTKQAVIVSAVSVLDRLWNGHGGHGWSESCEEDYITPLREHLAHDAMFSDDVQRSIEEKLDEVVAIGRGNLKCIQAAGDSESTLQFVDVDYLVQRSIEWCHLHPIPIPIAEDEEYRGHF